MVVRALDLGVNDYIVRPVDPNELVARSLTQIRRRTITIACAPTCSRR